MMPYYEHDGITIYCANCEDVLPIDYADLVLTDPPYGIGESSRKNQSRGQKTTPTDYGFYNWDTQPASDRAIYLARTGGDAAILWGGNFFTLPPQSKWLVWDKLNSGDFADCELAWTNLPGAVRIFRHMWNGMLRASERDGPRWHPTQKPIALMKWCLSFVPDAKLIVDPFCGSGSTLLAAKSTGRRAIGIDIEERYCEIAAKRLSQGVLDFRTE
jgi:DNA modification methylase